VCFHVKNSYAMNTNESSSRLFIVALSLAGLPRTFATTPLHAAVEQNDPTAVRTALADGANINELSEAGQTPLLHAAEADKLRAAASLMKMGADASIRGPTADGSLHLPPMHAAAAKGHAKIIKMLLRYEVDAIGVESDGLAPIHRASLGADAGHTDAVFALLDGNVPPDQPTSDGRQPIQLSGNGNTRQLLNEALREKRRRG
jgi:ankyrin repeat protein